MKKKSIATVLIALGCTLFADECCETLVGQPLDPCCINPMYPYPGAISLQCGWDIYARGDFLYFSSLVDSYVNTVSDIAFDLSETRYLFQKSPYRPGFRVSLGVDLDAVVLDLTYFRHHAHTTTHFNTRANGGIVINYIAPTILSEVFGQPRVFFQNVKSSRHLNFDYGILSVQKPVYMGKRIIMSLNYGLLGTWMQQKWNFDAAALTVPPPFAAGVTSNGNARANKKSWGVGPDLGFKLTGLLPWHLKAIFNVELSLMYGKCTKTFSMGSFPAVPLPVANNTINEKEHSSHLEAFHSGEIGIGWGDYFACERIHIDLYATYNFLFQHIFNYGIPFSPTGLDGMSLSNTSLHGIAIGGRLDF